MGISSIVRDWCREDEPPAVEVFSVVSQHCRDRTGRGVEAGDHVAMLELFDATWTSVSGLVRGPLGTHICDVWYAWEGGKVDRVGVRLETYTER